MFRLCINEDLCSWRKATICQHALLRSTIRNRSDDAYKNALPHHRLYGRTTQVNGPIGAMSLGSAFKKAANSRDPQLLQVSWINGNTFLYATDIYKKRALVCN